MDVGLLDREADLFVRDIQWLESQKEFDASKLNDGQFRTRMALTKLAGTVKNAVESGKKTMEKLKQVEDTHFKPMGKPIGLKPEENIGLGRNLFEESLNDWDSSFKKKGERKHGA